LLFLKGSFKPVQLRMLFNREIATFTLKGSNNLINWLDLCTEKDIKDDLVDEYHIPFFCGTPFQFYLLENVKPRINTNEVFVYKSFI
jgi:hypothetical protein